MRVIRSLLSAPLQLDLPISPFASAEVTNIIKHLNTKKAPGHDLVRNRTLKALPEIVLLFLAMVFIAILRVQYFPSKGKFAFVSIIPKPGKPDSDPASYRPISLLPSISKVWE